MKSLETLSNEFFTKYIRKHQLAADNLTEGQLADAFRQALAAGDFQRNVVAGTSAQSVVYIPWREREWLQNLYDELLYAVSCKYDGETRHETALRYIREREASTCSGEAKSTR